MGVCVCVQDGKGKRNYSQACQSAPQEEDAAPQSKNIVFY